MNSNWKVVAVRDICELINGRGFKPYEWTTTGLPIIRIQNLNGSKEFNFFDGLYDNKILVENDSLLFAWSGSRGTSFGPHIWIGQKALLNYHTWLVKIKAHSVDQRFLFYKFKEITAQIEGDAHGATALVHTQKREVEKIEIALPPLSEQRAIAEVLSDMDALIAAQEALIEKKRAIKQGAMQELLTGRRRLPGFEGEWEERQLGEILKVKHGRSQHDVLQPDGPYPVFASGGEIGRSKDYLYDRPSVLIGRKGTIDEPRYASEPFWTVDTLFYTEIDSGYHPKYIYHLFQTIRWMEYNEASGVPSLNSSTIEAISVKLPRIDEQIAISKIISDLDDEIREMHGSILKTKSLKTGMMHELLTGRIRLV